MTALWLGITVIACLAGIAAGVWLLVLAFREHLGWGLACCFIPFGALAFAIKYWEEAKRPFLYSLVSVVLAVVGMLGYSVTTVNSGLGEYATLGGPVNSDARPLSAAVDPEPAYSPDPIDVEVEVDEPLEEPAPAEPEVDSGSGRPTPDAGEEPHVESQPPSSHQRDKGVVVPTSDLGGMVGELVQLLLTSGERMSVRVENVQDHAVQVRQRVGGGSVAYTIDFEDIVEVRSRKEP